VDCLRSNGILFVGRYFSTYTWKVIKKEEAQRISDADMYIISIWQESANYPEYFSYNQGKSDGKNAFKYAAQIGQTPNTPVYLAVDFDATSEQKQRVLDYFRGVGDGYQEYLKEHGVTYKIGVYGSYWVLDWLKEEHIATYFYQAYAPGWSGGQNSNPWPGHNIQQTSAPQTLCGIEVDYDNASSNFGGWSFTTGEPSLAKVVITSPLQITPEKDKYFVGDYLTATFTVKNVGDEPITLDRLLLGGRYNGWELPGGGFPDSTYETVTLQAAGTQEYQGTFTVPESGNYRFFVAYYIENPTEAEKESLDTNNWNTCVDLSEGLDHTARVKNIVVLECPDSVHELRDRINLEFGRKVIYPPYLLDVDSFTSAVATLWINFTSWATQTHLADLYKELYYTGLEYDSLRLRALINARDALEAGDISSAERYLEQSHAYRRSSCMSFDGTFEVYDGALDAGEILAEGIKDGCEAAVSVGVAIVCPPAAAKVDAIYMAIDFGITWKLDGFDQATKDLAIKLVTKGMLKNLKFVSLGDSTLEAYVNRVSAEVPLDVLLSNNEFMTEFGLELQTVTVGKIIDEMGVTISEELVEEIVRSIVDQLGGLGDSVRTEIKSPAESRIRDSNGRVTGLMNGAVRHDIPMSVYYSGTVKVFYPTDSYLYEVVGTSTGIYGLEMVSIKGGQTVVFAVADIPTAANTTHHYQIDWDALSRGEEAISVDTDRNGDGIFEEAKTLRPPTASFNFSDGEYFVGRQIRFDGSQSYDADGKIARYEWDFGDGNRSTGVVSRHTYPVPREYLVSLTVVDNDGVISTHSRIIEINGVSEIPIWLWLIIIGGALCLVAIVVRAIARLMKR